MSTKYGFVNQPKKKHRKGFEWIRDVFVEISFRYTNALLFTSMGVFGKVKKVLNWENILILLYFTAVYMLDYLKRRLQTPLYRTSRITSVIKNGRYMQYIPRIMRTVSALLFFMTGWVTRISFRVITLALGWSCGCPSSRKPLPKNMGKATPELNTIEVMIIIETWYAKGLCAFMV